MGRAGNVVLAFAAPIVVLALAALTAWLALGGEETGLGPMRLVPIPPAVAASPAAADEPPPTTLEHISPLEAELRNALLPYSHLPLTPGVRYQAQDDRATALECMTSAIYYEAGQESVAGKRAVAQVILNRTRTQPFPRTVCGVVQQGAPRPGCQFTFMCDGSLGRRPDPGSWEAARQVAAAALSGVVDPEVGAATHYHADYVLPVWAATMFKLVKIGRHIFYRWPRARLDGEVDSPLPPLDASPPSSLIAGAIPPVPETVPAVGEPISPPPAVDAPPLRGAAAALDAEPPAPAAGSSPPPPAPVRPASPPRRALPETSLRRGPV